MLMLSGKTQFYVFTESLLHSNSVHSYLIRVKMLFKRVQMYAEGTSGCLNEETRPRKLCGFLKRTLKCLHDSLGDNCSRKTIYSPIYTQNTLITDFIGLMYSVMFLFI